MTPDFKIIADSQSVTAAIRRRYKSLRIEDRSGVISDSLEMVFSDAPPRLAIPRKGAALEVSLGYRETGLVKMGRFVVDEIELDPVTKEMLIRGKGANLRDSMKAPKTVCWKDGQTLSNVLTAIAYVHNLTPYIGGGLDDMPIGYRDQIAQSDMDFITELADEFDCVAKVNGGKLMFVPIGTQTTASGAALGKIPITLSDMKEGARFTFADRYRYRSAKAVWHDKGLAEQQSYTYGSGEPVYEVPGVCADAAEAVRRAVAALARARRGVGRGSIPLRGNPEIAAGRILALSNVREGIDGDWLVKSAAHEFSRRQGYITNAQVNLTGMDDTT